ncbi:MAG: hypothetical protein ACT4NY_30335 [Pseudonocardiales bacterium]
MFRDGGFWILDVPELTATGQARTLATAKDTARELVALWLDTPIDYVRVVMDYSRIDPETLEMVVGAPRAQAAADEMTRRAPSAGGRRHGG